MIRLRSAFISFGVSSGNQLIRRGAAYEYNLTNLKRIGFRYFFAIKNSRTCSMEYLVLFLCPKKVKEDLKM